MRSGNNYLVHHELPRQVHGPMTPMACTQWMLNKGWPSGQGWETHPTAAHFGPTDGLWLPMVQFRIIIIFYNDLKAICSQWKLYFKCCPFPRLAICSTLFWTGQWHWAPPSPHSATGLRGPTTHALKTNPDPNNHSVFPLQYRIQSVTGDSHQSTGREALY